LHTRVVKSFNRFTRYAVERLLYRLSRSEARERFVLKGAVLFYLWYLTSSPKRGQGIGSLAR
jgi:hypothetical protein